MILLSLLFIHCAMMSFAWLVRFRTGRSGWIDAIWSISVGFSGCVAAWAPFRFSDLSSRQWVVGMCVLVAFLRLGADLARRTRNSEDDARYLALQKSWGEHYKSRLFWFLQIQAVCGFILSLTTFLAARNPAHFGSSYDWIALFMVATSMAGETLADRQLRLFKQSHCREQVCDVGLWGMSRHPNYFFQWLFWVGLAIMAINFDGDWSEGFLAIGGPLMMYWLLVHVSGIPPLEKHMMQSRPEAFTAYRQRVGAFFPVQIRGLTNLFQKQ